MLEATEALDVALDATAELATVADEDATLADVLVAADTAALAEVTEVLAAVVVEAADVFTPGMLIECPAIIKLASANLFDFTMSLIDT